MISTYFFLGFGVLLITGGFLINFRFAVRLCLDPFPAMCPPLKLVASSGSLNEAVFQNRMDWQTFQPLLTKLAARRGIEPLLSAWQADVLTDRLTSHNSVGFLRWTRTPWRLTLSSRRWSKVLYKSSDTHQFLHPINIFYHPCQAFISNFLALCSTCVQLYTQISKKPILIGSVCTKP